MEMPQDNAILLSYVNMKLRDGRESVADLCAEHDWGEDELVRRLDDSGYVYDETRNAFVSKG